MKKISFTLQFALIVVLSYAQQPGTLDKNFGDTGVVVTGIPGISNQFSNLQIQKDNRIIVAGYYVDNNTNESGIMISRYLVDGSLDKDFANLGVSKMANGIYPRGMAIQDDGKIIVSGVRDYKGISTMCVARYSYLGTPDSSFASNGLYSDTSSGKSLTPLDVALQSDGKIIVCGNYYSNNEQGILYPFLKRLNIDGLSDKFFGDDGLYVYQFLQHLPSSLAIQTDDKIVTGGDYFGSFLIQRFTKDGIFDTSFGINGEVTTDFDKYEDFITGMALQPDGKIIAAGQARFNSFTKGVIPYMAVARYNIDGSLDKTFGQDGKAKVQFDASSKANAVAIQQNGKIITTGYVSNNNDENFALARLNDNGLLDSSFGLNGKTVTNIGSKLDEALGICLQSDGSIIAGGQEVTEDYIYNTVLAKYYGDPVKQLGPLTKKIRRWIKNHILNWEDVNDKDVAYYSVQQSNSVNGFTEIARVKPSGSNTYSYNLSNVSSGSQSNSYMVTAISNNGSNATSDVISDETTSSITISPNPVQDVMKIAGLSANQKTTISIINRNGNVVQTATANASTLNMNVAQLHSGIYNVVVTNQQENGILLSRYLSDGTLDKSFANDGQSLIINGISPSGLSVQKDDKIIVAGAKDFSGTPSLSVLRFTADGFLDSTYGTNGIYVDTISGMWLGATDIALQSDGKAVVCGNYYSADEQGILYPFLARYNTDGTPDKMFSGNGIIIFQKYQHLPNSISIQKDDKIVTGGTLFDGSFLVARYTKNGEYDSSFGTNGEVITNFDKYDDAITDITFQPDGKIVLRLERQHQTLLI